MIPTDDQPLIFIHSEPLPHGATLLRGLLADDPDYLRLGLLPPGYSYGDPPEIPTRAPGNYKDPSKIAEYLRDAKSKYMSETLPNWRSSEYMRLWDEFRKTRHLAHKMELGTIYLGIQLARTAEVKSYSYTGPGEVDRLVPSSARWVGWDRATLAAIGGHALRAGSRWGAGLLASSSSFAMADDIDTGRVPPGVPRPVRAVRELLGLDPLPFEDYRAAESWILGDDSLYEYHSLNAMADLVGCYSLLRG